MSSCNVEQVNRETLCEDNTVQNAPQPIKVVINKLNKSQQPSCKHNIKIRTDQSSNCHRKKDHLQIYR